MFSVKIELITKTTEDKSVKYVNEPSMNTPIDSNGNDILGIVVMRYIVAYILNNLDKLRLHNNYYVVSSNISSSLFLRTSCTYRMRNERTR